MKFEDRISQIKELENALYEKLFQTFKTSLAYDTRIRSFCSNRGINVLRGKNEKQEQKYIDDFYLQAKDLSSKKFKTEEMDDFEVKTIEYMKQLMDLIAQIEKSKYLTTRVDKYKSPMEYYNTVLAQNEKTYENFERFIHYMDSVGDLSKDIFVQKNLSKLLSFFEMMIHDSIAFDSQKIGEEYVEYLIRMENEKQSLEEAKIIEEIKRQQREEDLRFVSTVNDRFTELKSTQTRLGVIGTDRVEELALMIGSFIEELEQTYGSFPLNLGDSDFATIMSANEDVANAKMYVNESTSAIFERYKNAEENFAEDLKEKPNGSIKDLFDEFRKRVETLQNKYGAIEMKQDYTPEEVEQIARAYQMAESILADLDKIRESNHFTYGIVE